MTSQNSLQDIIDTLTSRSDSAFCLPPLTPKSAWDSALTSAINKLPHEVAGDVLKACMVIPYLFAPFLRSRFMCTALHLLNDDIAQAHDLAQAHEESQSANLAHAILHRREGDYWNSVSAVMFCSDYQWLSFHTTSHIGSQSLNQSASLARTCADSSFDLYICLPSISSASIKCDQKWWLSRISHPLLTAVHGGVKGAKKFVDDVESLESSAGSSNGKGQNGTAQKVRPGGEKGERRIEYQEKQFEELKGLVEAARREEGGSG